MILCCFVYLFAVASVFVVICLLLDADWLCDCWLLWCLAISSGWLVFCGCWYEFAYLFWIVCCLLVRLDLAVCCSIRLLDFAVCFAVWICCLFWLFAAWLFCFGCCSCCFKFVAVGGYCLHLYCLRLWFRACLLVFFGFLLLLLFVFCLSLLIVLF